MSNIKQVIVMRNDLNMRKGKMCSQSSHSTMKVFLDLGEVYYNPEDGKNWFKFPITSEMKEWIEGIFTKICVRVDSEEQLMEVYNKAKEANLPCALIEDAGLTEFNGVVTKTCCAIGPANAEEIDKITGELKLL